jgi:hypothetical protein
MTCKAQRDTRRGSHAIIRNDKKAKDPLNLNPIGAARSRAESGAIETQMPYRSFFKQYLIRFNHLQNLV